ncbi:MAG: patatin-like phospholipase family protein [Candidatus Promineofilum sp.]|nr:patatin-like phospholipase family protein [Promineifilum sp.]
MRYDLVFEGGGAKGMAFAGAMREFEAAGHTAGRIIGSSAGAITAATLAAGYSAAEMLAALGERVSDAPVFTTFLGDPPPPSPLTDSAVAEFLRAGDLSFVPGWAEDRLEKGLLNALAGSELGRQLLSFFDYGGFYSADAFVDWFERKLDEGLHDGRPRRFGKSTFAELYAATGVDLSLTASDISHNRLRILNHRTTPDVPVVWGARMSMSFPLLWQEVIWREAWGPYRGYVDGKPVEFPLAGSVMVDGGLLSNFPIELLVSREPLVTQIMGPEAANAVVGFLIDESRAVAGAPPPAAGHSLPGMDKLGASHTAQRLKGLVDTVTQARDKMVIDENRSRVVRLPAKTYGTTEFGMVDARRDALIEAAAAATRAYFLAQPDGGLEALDPGPTAESDRIALGILGIE